jgi:SOS response regulatory protein OraA/RecX
MASCYEYALHYLSNYPKTEQEIHVKLRTKWYDTPEIERAMEVLKKQWYLWDLQFTKLYVESELVKKGKPAALVRAKLLQKWVDRHLIKEIMDKNDEEITEWIHSAIKQQIDKLKKRWIDWFDIIQKLMQKGYRISDIKKTIKANHKED